MVSKGYLAIFLLVLVTLTVDAQRDSRRRSGRRKPTTEQPLPADVEPEIEKSPQKLDSELETFSKPSNIDVSEPESLAATPNAKDDANNGNHTGHPLIVPRGTRKPRLMQMKNNGQARPRPTLPTFSRKSSGRMHKNERQDNQNNGVELSPLSTTTTKPSRSGSRRRNGGQVAPRNSVNSNKSSDNVAPSQQSNSTEPLPKKRFGGGSRRPARTGRRSTTISPQLKTM